MGKGAVAKHNKSVKHVQNSESRKSSSAVLGLVPKISLKKDKTNLMK